MAFVLLPALIMPLVRTGPGHRTLGRRRVDSRLAGPAAVLIGAPLLAFSMAPFLGSRGSGWQVAVLLASPGVAYSMVWLANRPRPAVAALRGAGLLLVLVGAELAALRVGGSVVAIALVVAAAYLGCWRLVDHGYWPILLLRDAGLYGLVVAVVGWFGAGQLATIPALLWWGVAAVAGFGLAVGGWRLARWLRTGPPASPGPPGVRNWPPEAGEVWSAADQLVLVWDSTPADVRVLQIDGIEGPGRLPLPLSEWDGVLTRDSWLSMEITPMPFAAFGRLRGACRASLWSRLRADPMIREQAGVAPGFGLLDKVLSAMNRQVSPSSLELSLPRQHSASDRRSSRHVGARRR
jgi:hypothetical protein